MLRRRLIDHDAHRAFGRMRADVDHAAREALVLHRRAMRSASGRRDSCRRRSSRRRFSASALRVNRMLERLPRSCCFATMPCVHDAFQWHVCRAVRLDQSSCDKVSAARISPEFAAGSQPVSGAGRCRSCGRCVAVGRRPALRRAADCRARRATKSGGRSVARRRRDQAAAGLEDLLALSGRFRRAAGVRFLGSENVKSATVLWPAPVRFPRRRRPFDRLQGRGDLSAARRAAGCRQAGDAAAQARLCGLREALRAGRGQGRTCCSTGGPRPHDAALEAAEARVPKPLRSAAMRRAGDPRKVRRESGSGKPHGRRRGRCAGGARRRSVRRRPDAGMGAAAARAGRGRAGRVASALRSNSMACRPARSRARRRRSRLTAVAGGDAIEAVFRLD